MTSKTIYLPIAARPRTGKTCVMASLINAIKRIKTPFYAVDLDPQKSLCKLLPECHENRQEALRTVDYPNQDSLVTSLTHATFDVIDSMQETCSHYFLDMPQPHFTSFPTIYDHLRCQKMSLFDVKLQLLYIFTSETEYKELQALPRWEESEPLYIYNNLHVEDSFKLEPHVPDFLKQLEHTVLCMPNLNNELIELFKANQWPLDHTLFTYFSRNWKENIYLKADAATKLELETKVKEKLQTFGPVTNRVDLYTRSSRLEHFYKDALHYIVS